MVVIMGKPPSTRSGNRERSVRPRPHSAGPEVVPPGCLPAGKSASIIMRKIQPEALAGAQALWMDEAVSWLRALDLAAEPRLLLPHPDTQPMSSHAPSRPCVLCIVSVFVLL